jgi:hypothetical protein
MSNRITMMVDCELTERTLATLWKYAKYILWFHVQGVLSENETA